MSDRAEAVALKAVQSKYDVTMRENERLASALRASEERAEKAERDLFETDLVVQRLNSGAELQAIMAAHNEALARESALQARVVKLEEALRWFANLDKWLNGETPGDDALLDIVQTTARAALEDKP